MPPATVITALREILALLETNPKAARELGVKASKEGDLSAAFAPLSSLFNGGSTRELIVQRCLELPVDAPLHGAAAALVADGTIRWTPWVSVSQGVRPARWIRSLLVSRVQPLVFGIETGPRVSVWSLETGAHVGDLAFSGNKDTIAKHVVELDDGTLRVLTSLGAVCECAPGAKSFIKVLDVGAVKWNVAFSSNLGLLVNQLESQPVERDGVNHQRFGIHDVQARSSREIVVPYDYPETGWVWDRDRAVMALQKSHPKPEGDEEWRADYFLAIVDARSGELTAFPFERSLFDLRHARPGVVSVTLAEYAGAGDPERVEIDLATGAATPVAEEEIVDESYLLRLDDGRSFNIAAGELRDAGEDLVTTYALEGDPYNKIGAYDPVRGRFILAGNDPAVPVTLIAPYDPARVASVAAPPIALESIEWARAGVVLSYEIADFDATDEWTFTVRSAHAGLVLAIDMGAESVAVDARFNDAAMESATSIVALAQGGADVDLSDEQSSYLPPIVISRAAHAKLAAKEPIEWTSEWSGATTLEPFGGGTASIVVDGTERIVSVLRAEAEDGVALLVLDDPRWPLVIERLEGDCNVRLKSIDVSRASAPRLKLSPARTPAPAPPETVTETRRFQLAHGNSAKFWELSTEGTMLTVRYGKVGTAGQSNTKDLGSVGAVAKEAAKLIREKTKKGYAEQP